MSRKFRAIRWLTAIIAVSVLVDVAGAQQLEEIEFAVDGVTYAIRKVEDGFTPRTIKTIVRRPRVQIHVLEGRPVLVTQKR